MQYKTENHVVMLVTICGDSCEANVSCVMTHDVVLMMLHCVTQPSPDDYVPAVPTHGGRLPLHLHRL